MKRKIPETLKIWAKSISQRDSGLMTSLYSKRAILLATFESLLIGKKEIRGYFDTFLDKENLKCTITDNYTKMGNNRATHVANGIYEFSYTENGKEEIVVARYTYVIHNDLIITHHSSVNP